MLLSSNQVSYSSNFRKLSPAAMKPLAHSGAVREGIAVIMRASIACQARV